MALTISNFRLTFALMLVKHLCDKNLKRVACARGHSALTVFSTRLYHRCLTVRFENPPEMRTEAKGRDQTRYH
jgi:hypothetical protein